MSALNKEQILDAVAGMSVLDLSELIKAMETKFGVSAAAAAVAVAAPVGAAPVAEAKTEFNVILVATGEKKVEVIKAVRAVTGAATATAAAAADTPNLVSIALMSSDRSSTDMAATASRICSLFNADMIEFS